MINNREKQSEFSKMVIESHSKKMLQQEQMKSANIHLNKDTKNLISSEEGIKFLLEILTKNKGNNEIEQIYKEIDDVEFLKCQRQQLLKLKQSVDIGIKVLNEEQRKINKFNIKSPKLSSNYHKMKQKHHNSSHASLLLKKDTSPNRPVATFRPNLLSQFCNEKSIDIKNYHSPPSKNSFNNYCKITPGIESKSPVEMLTCKTAKNFRPKFKKPPYKYECINQEATTNDISGNKSFINSQSTKELKRSVGSLGNLNNSEQNNFKLKSSIKLVNLKLLSSLVHLKYTKFYFCTICALIDTICIVNNKDVIFFEDWQSMILYINQNQLRMQSEISNSQYSLQRMKFDLIKLAESRLNYFGNIKSENELLKECQNSKEIRSILKFIFSIYRYVENNKKKDKNTACIASFISDHSDNKTACEQKQSMISSSNDLNSSRNVLTPTHAPHSSKFTKASTQCKTPTNKSENNRIDYLHRGSVKYEYKNKIYSVKNYNDNFKSDSTEYIPTFTRTSGIFDHDKSIITEINGVNEEIEEISNNNAQKRRKSRAERNKQMSKSKDKYTPISTSKYHNYIHSNNLKSNSKLHKEQFECASQVKCEKSNSVIQKIEREMTPNLLKSRQKNEADLEELESSIFENISSSRNIINRNSSHNNLYEEKPLIIDSTQCDKNAKFSDVATPKEFKKGTKYAEFKRQSKRNTSKNQDINPEISSTIEIATNNEANANINLNIQEQLHHNNFSQNFELPPRCIPRVSKKVFKEDTDKGDDVEEKPDNCFSFTNQTEMFDNYDSNNSTLSNRMHEVIKEEDLSNRHDENESFTIKIDNDTKSLLYIEKKI